MWVLHDCGSRPGWAMIFVTAPELLPSFRRGDPAALEKVYWTYVKEIEKLARRGVAGRIRSGLRSEVDDIVQEVFLKAFRPRARISYDERRPFGAFLGAIARNEIVDRGRRMAREIAMDADAINGVIDKGDQTEVSWADPGLAAIILDYVSGLTVELREIHDARFVEMVPQRIAAVRLGISRQQMRTREQQVRGGLARALRARQILVSTVLHGVRNDADQTEKEQPKCEASE